MNDLRALRDYLDAFQAEVGNWSRHNFPRNQPYQPLLGMGEETGELMHAHLKAEQGIRGTPTEHKAAKLDAIGDILIYLADYCERNDLELGTAVTEAWASVRQRDWIKFPGNGVDK